VERVQLLRHLRRPRRLAPRPRRGVPRPPSRARPLAARRARRRRGRGHRRARGIRRPWWRHPPGPVRRRPLQLVRPP
jgi:hypothetical protein